MLFRDNNIQLASYLLDEKDADYQVADLSLTEFYEKIWND